MITLTDENGPIEFFEWGKIKINGQMNSKQEGLGKDLVISKEEIKPWKERVGHDLNIEMVKDHLKSKKIIIGNGVWGYLKVPESVKEYVEEQGKELIVLATPSALEMYNKLHNKNEEVTLLVHGTC